MCIHTHTHKDRYVIVAIWMNMLMKFLFAFQANSTMRCSGYHSESLLGWGYVYTLCSLVQKVCSKAQVLNCGVTSPNVGVSNTLAAVKVSWPCKDCKLNESQTVNEWKIFMAELTHVTIEPHYSLSSEHTTCAVCLS